MALGQAQAVVLLVSAAHYLRTRGALAATRIAVRACAAAAAAIAVALAVRLTAVVVRFAIATHWRVSVRAPAIAFGAIVLLTRANVALRLIVAPVPQSDANVANSLPHFAVNAAHGIGSAGAAGSAVAPAAAPALVAVFVVKTRPVIDRVA